MAADNRSGLEHPRRMASNRIRELREARGLTLEELADRLGTTHPTVQRWESGKRGFDRWVQKLSEVLGVHPGELYRPMPEKGASLTEMERQAAELVKRLPADQRAAWLQIGRGLTGETRKPLPARDHRDKVHVRRRRADQDDTTE